MAKQRRRNLRPTRDRAERPYRPRRLFVEQLEPRTLLAVDIGVIPADAWVFNFGDSAPMSVPDRYSAPQISQTLSNLEYEYDQWASSHGSSPVFGYDSRIRPFQVAGPYLTPSDVILKYGPYGTSVLIEASPSTSENALLSDLYSLGGASSVEGGHVVAWVPLEMIGRLPSLPSLAFAETASVAPMAPVVRYTLSITDLDGSPLTSLAAGQEFVLHAYTEDLRAAPQGVAAAYIDVHWDSSLAVAEKGLDPDELTWQSRPDGSSVRVQSGIRHTQTYGNAKSGDTSIPGVIDGAGGFAGFADLGAGTYEVFSILMKSTGSGNLVFTTSSPDLSTPAYDTILYDRGRFPNGIPPNDMEFGSASIEIAPADVISSPSPTRSAPAQPQPVVSQPDNPASAQSPTDPGSVAGPANDDQTMRATIKLEATDLKGVPITSVNVGQDFEVRAYLVLTAAPTGVQPVSGFADVTYPSSLIAPANNAADVGLVGSTVGNGLIDEAGRVVYGDSSGLMFTKTFTATKKGTATFAANAAEGFGHEIYVTGLNDPLPWSQITFGSTTLTIKP